MRSLTASELAMMRMTALSTNLVLGFRSSCVGEFFCFGVLLPLFGVAGDLDGECDDLEIEVVGLVYGGHQRFFRSHHVVGAGFEMGEQRLDDP